MNVERHQAVIIGGGPAGLAAAIRLRQKGCLLYTSRCV